MTDIGTNQEEVKNKANEMILQNSVGPPLRLGGIISSMSTRGSSRAAQMVFFFCGCELLLNVSQCFDAVLEKGSLCN